MARGDLGETVVGELPRSGRAAQGGLRIGWIHVSPVKGMAVVECDAIRLDESGPPGDRRFAMVDGANRVVNGKRLGGLCTIRGSYVEDSGMLLIQPAADAAVSAPAVAAGRVIVSVHGRLADARFVPGPWDDVLSDRLGPQLRLVRFERAGEGVDRGHRGGGVTLLSRASLAGLGQAAGGRDVDARRFRMTFGIDGARPFEEDAWIGRPLRIGEATVLPLGHVGRCAVTMYDADTGMRDLDTLRILARLRRTRNSTERLPLGIWGRVERPGMVRVGDALTPAANWAGQRASG